jgi:hypothetical protein
MKVLHVEQAARMPGVSSLFLAAWLQVARFGLGVAILAPFLIGRKFPTRLEIRQGLVIDFWGGSAMWLQADALAYTEAGLIYTTEPAFTAIYVLFLPAMLGEFIGGSYPNEHLSTQLLVGGSLILVANVLMQWKRPPHLPPAGPVP